MANERARGLGYKYITDDKYLVNPFSPTEGISYEGDGSPVSYANSGIMSQAPIPAPLKYIPREGGGEGPVDTGPPGSYDSAFDPVTENKEFNEDIGVGTVAEEDDEKSFGISKSRAAAYGLGMMFDPITTMLTARRHQNKEKQKEIDKINEKINKQYGYNTQSNDGSGLNDGPDGGYTGSGNEGVSKSDPTHSDNYDMKNGGRAGYFFGGRVNYKAGGETAGPGDTGGEGGENPQDKSDTQFGGGGDNNPSFYEPKTSFFKNPQTLYKNTNLGFNVPTGLTTGIPYGRLSAIMNLNKTIEEKEPEGKVQYDNSMGPVDTRASYDTITGPEFNASYTNNNFNANLNSKTGLGVNYSKDIGPGTFTVAGDIDPYGNYNTEARYGISFANGGIASIL